MKKVRRGEGDRREQGMGGRKEERQREEKQLNNGWYQYRATKA